MEKQILIIFVRNTVPGRVKTRLAKMIGDEAALKIYKLLLQHTFGITKSLHCDKIVYYSEAIAGTDNWDIHYKKSVQQGKDLGARMCNAFKTAFVHNYESAVIIGSDSYDLTTVHIEEAFEKLNTRDVVIGPAADGGYYLLGMKTLHPGVFKEKAWGTATVLAETLENLKESKVYLLETLNDIDTYEDIINVDAFKQFLKPNL